MTTLQHPRSKELEALSIKASRVFVDEGLFGMEAEVVAVLDVSPRMTPLYADGSLQRLVTALLALGMKFDDDGIVPVWTYSDEARQVGKIRRENSVAWVEQNLQAPPILRPGMKLPPSRFAPFIDAIAQKYFPREWATPPVTRQVGDRLKRSVHEYASLIEPRPCPVFVIVVTSGDCDDPMETSKLLRRASHLPIFWQFAAVAATEGQRPEFRFLRGLDKLTETHVDSCGFFEAEDFEDAEALYRGLLGEFVRYIEHEQVKAMLVRPSQQAPEESVDAIAANLLGLPKAEAERRERQRLERERRRALREKETAAELQRADAWPKIASDAQDPEPPEDDAELDPSDTEPNQRRSNPTTQPRPRIKRETMPYAPQSDEADSPEGEPDEAAAPLPAPTPAPTPARPATRRSHETRAFERVVIPPPRAPESSVVLEGFDQDDLEDTVETAAERLQRIRARREARRAGGGPSEPE